MQNTFKPPFILN